MFSTGESPVIVGWRPFGALEDSVAVVWIRCPLCARRLLAVAFAEELRLAVDERQACYMSGCRIAYKDVCARVERAKARAAPFRLNEGQARALLDAVKHRHNL